MSSIKSLRPLVSGLATSASLAGGLFFIVADEADAQDMLPAPQPAAGDAATHTDEHTNGSASVILLPAVKVGGQASQTTNELQATTGISRMPDTLQSTPQTITVIPHIMIEQQQATTLDQVLQYVPGVTVATGEGNGGINGDQFRIRGFDASGDMYVDGLRDFGSYVRDDFATENVEVLKGPSSQSFGNGSSGGVIELESKKAHLGDKNTADISGGSGPYGRGVLDINKQVGKTTAFRVAGMLHGQDIVDRDHVYSNRWGVLASLGFGLGTDHSVTLNYLHQYSNRRPDFGVPMPSTGNPAAPTEPVTEYGVPRSNYYGRESDHARQDADIISLLYTGKINNWLTITNDSRFGVYSSDMRFTPSLCLNGFGSTCGRDAARGNLNTHYMIWQVGGNSQTSYGGENVTTAIAKFNTFGLRHELISGVDVYSQNASLNFYGPVGPEPAGTLLHPIYNNSPGFRTVGLSGSSINATSWDVGPFINDRVWLLKTLSIMGGVRWDHYHVDGVAEGPRVHSTTQLASPKAALIWEPTKHQTYYFNFSRAFTPPASNITSLSTSNGIQGGGNASALTPETSYSYEVGAKFSLLHDRLGLTAAAFRVEKNNARYTDQITGIQSATGDRDRVQGFEFGATGKITPHWDIQASYTYMDSNILSSSITQFSPRPAKGNRVPYVSRHGLSVWTTYDVTSFLQGMPGHLLVGGGFNYRSQYYLDNAMSLRIPAAVTADAMISYDIKRYHAAVNVQNLNNTLAYSSAFANGYATPVAGRTVIATVGLNF
ncbi:TonB-dependent siderophore receptor [Gluconobacter sp. OJB]|uniref:TonB-dependent receptor n=1 Tax=Gluconobacter sp. OJB TaxID=3145196 RepID=UPI0031F78730